MPTNSEMESILKFRSEGHFSDKNSDFLDPQLRQKRPRQRTSNRASEGGRRGRGWGSEEVDMQQEEESEEQMQGDDPYASGQIFSLGGFSQEATDRRGRVKSSSSSSSSSTSSAEVSSIERAYRLKPYIQLYNKLSKLQLEVKMGGDVRVTNAVITKNCK